MCYLHKKFNDIHALKSHQPKCRDRTIAHIDGFRRLKREEKRKKKKTGRKIVQGIDITEEELVANIQLVKTKHGRVCDKFIKLTTRYLHQHYSKV